MLPQALKERFNYKTHMVGKWHVGARSEANLPVERGFDSHFGFLKGGEDHLTQESSDANLQFVDLWRNRKPAYHENGTFSTIMYTQEAVDIITRHGHHSIKDPLFMFLAYQATHTPLEVPAGWNVESVKDDTKSKSRSHMNALVESLDQGVGHVTRALNALACGIIQLLFFKLIMVVGLRILLLVETTFPLGKLVILKEV